MKIIAHPTWDKIGQFAAIGIAFALPVSTAVTSYCMAIVLISWLLGSEQREKRAFVFHHPLMIWIWPLVLVTLLGMFYSIGEFTAIRRAAMDGVRLAFIPFFMFYYRSPQVAKKALWAFCLAMILTLILGFLKVYAGLPIGMKFTVGAVFKSHIKTSFFMAIAAFFLVYQIKILPRYRTLWIVLILLMIYYLLFLSAGRIGYITLGVCSLFYAWQEHRFKGIVIALLLASSVFGGAYLTSSIFADRINILSQDLDFYHGGRLIESSLGSRLHFAFSSIDLMEEHPWIGSGTGSFGVAYARSYHGDNTLYTDNPHNEYLRVGVELGIVGLFCLLLMFIQQWRLSWQIPGAYRGFIQGILLAFFIGCFINSWLKDFTEGYFYCVMIAIGFSAIPFSARRPLEAANLAHIEG